MEKKYKIGDISKLVNMPIQTLRFYEEKNILTPYKDTVNGYRYYDAWSFNDLLDALILRSSDFSLSQTESIINTKSLDDISKEYIKQETLLLEKIEHYKMLLSAVSESRMKMQNFKHQLGKFTKCICPDLVFHRYREKDTFQTCHGDKNLEQLARELSPWINTFPLALPTFYIPYFDLNQIPDNDMSYWWGFSMPYEKSSSFNIRPEDPNEYIPSTNAIYTVFEAQEKGTFISSFYEQVYTNITGQGYLINGSPFGRLIVKTHEFEDYKRYFEVWVPVS